MPKNTSEYGGTPRDRRLCDDPDERTRNEAINAIHPGPAPDFTFPAPEPETKRDKLTRLERELVDHACASARPSGLAIRIIALRAEING